MSGDYGHKTVGLIIKRILVPFDNSPLSIRAFGHALDFATKFGASIIVISIIQDEFRKSWVDDTSTRKKNTSENRRAILKDGMKRLQNIAQKFNISVEHEIIVSRNIAESIISVITSKKIDCVVMGTRGKGMRKEMMLGRVSTSVAVNANCPVVLVK
jgi:nucleotide-binding universal stress UspA family protein